MSKGIFVVVEQRRGQIEKVGLELLGKARDLAADLNQEVAAVLIGADMKDKCERLIHYGADKVILIEDPVLEHYMTEPYTKAVTEVVRKYEPEIVLFGASSIGRDLAPRVSARVHTGLTADCTSLAINEENKNLLMTRPAFGGNIMATIICPNFRPQMATVRPGVMKAIEKDTGRTGDIEELKITFTEADQAVKIRKVVNETHKKADITEAKILVSAGRGVGDQNGVAPLAELADVLGGQVSGSRAAVDGGWLEKDRQVGQTGKTVRPDLYIACGISGAIQHVAGMGEAEFIVAINKNETAPIFDVADFGVIGDLKTIVPKLTEAIRKVKEEKAKQ